MPTKKSVVNNRVYFISDKPDDDISMINDYFVDKRPSFIDKIYKTKIMNGEIPTYFINIKINIEINEADFNKFADKLNMILNKSHKMFYKDTKTKYTYIPLDIKNDINNSFNMFINDD